MQRSSWHHGYSNVTSAYMQRLVKWLDVSDISTYQCYNLCRGYAEVVPVMQMFNENQDNAGA